MIMAYGMSEKLGQVSFDRGSQPLFLQQGMGRAAAKYSEELARESRGARDHRQAVNLTILFRTLHHFIKLALVGRSQVLG